ERAELVDHRVDGVLELEDLALHVDGDLLREVAGSDRLRHVGDVPDLRGQVAGHEVDAVGQVLPGAGDRTSVGQATEVSLRADLPRDPCHPGRERAELIDHRVDGVLQLKDLAAHVDGDLLREVARRDGGRHLGDVPDLRRQVTGHQVHAVGQVLPGA